MNAIVVGGSGFLGRHVIDALLAAGHSVVLLARGTRSGDLPPAVRVVRCDVGAGPLPLEPLRGCDAIVNLAGIKREDGTQTFDRVHVVATKNLLAAAKELGIKKFVQISVVASRPDSKSGYHNTKWQAEELVRASGLNFTILKPAVIYGPGDDMITHLVKMIRFVPVFPVVGKGDSLLQPVHVRDVALAVVRSLERDQAAGKTYDIVGPKRLQLKEVVRTVADGTSLNLWILKTPIWFQRLAVGLMGVVSRNPLSTPAQLQMLIDGLYGDPEPARADLGLEPIPFTTEEVRPLAVPIPPLFGFSPRLVQSSEHAGWVNQGQPAFGKMLLFLILAIVLLKAFSLTIPNIWYRMTAFYLVMTPPALALLPLRWRELLTPSYKHIATGAVTALLLYMLGGGVFFALANWFPLVASEAQTLYGWKEQLPAGMAVALLVFIIVPGEEIIWRGAITIPAAAWWGPWWGCLFGAAMFTAVHMAFGSSLLLLACAGAGFFWSWIAIKTQSILPCIVCHLLFDLTALYGLPFIVS